MNENINLSEILKDCPKGWKLYSSVYGEVEFVEIMSNITDYPVIFEEHDSIHGVSIAGEHFKGKGECTFFPSREQRDWSKFTAPWYKKKRFDPVTLKVFDKVLVKTSNEYFNTWFADFVAEPTHVKNETPLIIGAKEADMVIPYNDNTKHLVGTTDEAPEYYKYWED